RRRHTRSRRDWSSDVCSSDLEEMGGYGSHYFSEQLEPDKVVAMFNLEMIGTTSKWGRNSAYITGFEKSSLGSILQNNLQDTHFQYHHDTYHKQNLFYSSYNAKDR